MRSPENRWGCTSLGATGVGGRLGKSIVSQVDGVDVPPGVGSAARVTQRGPERESKVTEAESGYKRVSTTNAAASVAWPQRSTSSSGVNHLMW